MSEEFGGNLREIAETRHALRYERSNELCCALPASERQQSRCPMSYQRCLVTVYAFISIPRKSAYPSTDCLILSLFRWS